MCKCMCLNIIIMTIIVKITSIGSSKSYFHGTAMVSLWFEKFVLFDLTIMCQNFANIRTFIFLSLDLDQSSLLQLTQQPLQLFWGEWFKMMNVTLLIPLITTLTFTNKVNRKHGRLKMVNGSDEYYSLPLNAVINFFLFL